MPAPDWLEGLGGGLLGINKGLSIAMDPYKAYESVRTQSLTNDKSDIELRDLLASQQAREGLPVPDFYGNRVAALDTTNRVASSKGAADIYGIDTNLALAKYLADPNDAFQQGVQQAGLEPGTPEYASWLTEAIQMYNPQASVAANATFKVPELEQRNLSKQAVLSYVQAYANKYDQGATAEWAADGTITVTGSDGEKVTGLNPDVVLRAASMSAAKDPQAPILAGINAQTNVQKANADLLKAIQTGQATPAQTYQYLQSTRVAEQGIWNKALQAEQLLKKETDYLQADPEQQKEMRDRARQNTDRAYENLNRTIKHMRDLSKTVATDAEITGAGDVFGAPSGVAPVGAPSVTAFPFGPRGAGASRATGGGNGQGPWGASSAGPAYPTKAAATMSNIESVVQAILNGAR